MHQLRGSHMTLGSKLILGATLGRREKENSPNLLLSLFGESCDVISHTEWQKVEGRKTRQ